MRKVKFVNNEYYHIYNRGADKRDIFCCNRDYVRFLESMRQFNNNLGDSQRKYIKSIKSKSDLDDSRSDFDFNPLVEVVYYCLNSNHYHLLLKQVGEGGITLFIRKLATGYTNYFNQKYDRSGVLFQGKFKSVHVNSNEYLLWLSGYINGNIEIHGIPKAETYKWCSYPDYSSRRKGTLCNKEIILSQFKNLQEYEKFVKMTIKGSRNRKDLERYFIE